MQQERFPEAVESFRKAVEYDPDFGAAHLRLGTLLPKLGQWEEAKVHLKEAVRIQPYDPYSHFNLGIIYCQNEEFEQGVVHLENALQRNPNFLPALISLSLIRAASPNDALRDDAEAVDLATRACELSRYENPVALHALAAAYAEAGRFPDAIATVEVALRLARDAAQEKFTEELQRMLGLFQQQKPYRSSPR